MRRVLVSTVVAAVLVACAGDGSIDSSTSTTAAAAPTTSAVPTTTTVAPTTTFTPAVMPERSITVGGMGAEYTEPERSTVDIGVRARRDTVLKASKAASKALAVMTAALLDGGVEASNIQTSDFSIGPFFDNYPTVAGYEVHVGMRVTVTDIGNLGSVLASAIEAGGDDVSASGIRFEADVDPLIEPARAAAWADVMRRAESVVGLAGLELGDVLDIHEKVLITSPQGMMQGGEGDSASFDIPVSPGRAGVTVLMTVKFAVS